MSNQRGPRQLRIGQLRIASRRMLLASAALVLGLSACGDPSTRPAASPAVIALSAPGSRVAAPASEADSAMWAPYGSISYVFNGAFPDLPATGPSWFLPVGTQPNLNRLQAMARVLGVDGDVAAVPGGEGQGWMAGAVDYSTSNIWLSTDSMQSWWYNPDPSVWESGNVVCAVAEPAPDGSTVPVDPVPPMPCPEPTPPTGIPGADEALARAKALATDLGYDAGSYDWEVWADEWNANVSGVLLLDGVRSAITFSVGFGAEGAITWASGSLATPQRGEDYPVVGPQAGLDRLNDESGQWFGLGVDPMTISSRSVGVGSAGADSELVDPVPGEAPMVEPAVVDPDLDPALVDPPQTDSAQTDPGKAIEESLAVDPAAPIECGPAVDCAVPEPITIAFTNVMLGATTVWAADGTVWILPAYVFESTDQGMYTVIAVDDSFIQLPEQPVTEPVPAPEPPPDTPEPSVVVAVDEALATDLLVGLTEDEAAKVAAEYGWTLRVTERDGEFLVMTDDFSLTRVNVAVESGFVIQVARIG